MLELNKIYCMDCIEGMKMTTDEAAAIVRHDKKTIRKWERATKKWVKKQKSRRRCAVCGMEIVRGSGVRYRGRLVHPACLGQAEYAIARGYVGRGCNRWAES